MKFIPVAQPHLQGNEVKYVLDCLETGWVSSVGKYVTAFEEAFAAYCGVKHAIATSNGTTALHLALVALGVKPGDEVIVPTVTFIASANAVTYCGATPVLADVLPGTLNLDPQQVAALITPRTRGILPVHLYGHPVDMAPIQRLAQQHGLFVLEDAAEAHGAEYQGQRVGSLGTAATFSFFGNKIITTGEGGMVTTNDDDLAAQLRLYRGQGMDPQRRYWFEVVGYNYRITNLQAALGLAQLETIDQALEHRQCLHHWYTAALASLGDQLDFPQPQPWGRAVHWMCNVYLKHGGAARRDAVMQYLARQGIETRPVFYPLHQMPPYYSAQPFPVANDWAARGISLPTHSLVSQQDLARVVDTLAQALKDVP